MNKVKFYKETPTGVEVVMVKVVSTNKGLTARFNRKLPRAQHNLTVNEATVAMTRKGYTRVKPKVKVKVLAGGGSKPLRDPVAVMPS